MLFQPLVMVCVVGICLASSAAFRLDSTRQDSVWRSQRRGCQPKWKPHYKPTVQGSAPKKDCTFNRGNISSKAAQVANAAKEAQICAGEEAGQRAKIELALKAEEAARSAAATLTSKKQLIGHLMQSQCEANAVVEEVKNALKKSLCSVEQAVQLACTLKKQMEKLNKLFKLLAEDLKNLKELAANIHRDVYERQRMLEMIKKRLCEVRKCLVTARKSYEATKKNAYKATAAAIAAERQVQQSRDYQNDKIQLH